MPVEHLVRLINQILLLFGLGVGFVSVLRRDRFRFCQLLKLPVATRARGTAAAAAASIKVSHWLLSSRGLPAFWSTSLIPRQQWQKAQHLLPVLQTPGPAPQHLLLAYQIFLGWPFCSVSSSGFMSLRAYGFLVSCLLRLRRLTRRLRRCNLRLLLRR